MLMYQNDSISKVTYFRVHCFELFAAYDKFYLISPTTATISGNIT